MKTRLLDQNTTTTVVLTALASLRMTLNAPHASNTGWVIKAPSYRLKGGALLFSS